MEQQDSDPTFRREADRALYDLAKNFETHCEEETVAMSSMKEDIRSIKNSVEELVILWQDIKGVARVTASVGRFIIWTASVTAGLAALWAILKGGGIK